MKKILIISLMVLLIAGNAYALTDIQNRMWQLCGAGWVAQVQAYMGGLNLNFRSQNSVSVMRDWLKISSGQSGSLALVFSNDVYDLFISKFDGWSLSTSITVNSDHAAPTSCTVAGSDITCDEPSLKTLVLYSWNAGTQLFTDTEDVASCVASVCTFSSPGAGTYVVGLSPDLGNSFCTPYLVIP